MCKVNLEGRGTAGGGEEIYKSRGVEWFCQILMVCRGVAVLGVEKIGCEIFRNGSLLYLEASTSD